MSVADINGDGKLDTVIADNENNVISVLLGDGKGRFAASTDFTCGWSSSTLSVTDMNGDGKLDVITANFYNGNVSVLLGDGKGSFATTTTFTGSGNTSNMSVADVNGDDKLDVITTEDRGNYTPNGNISVLLGDGKGSLALPTAFSGGQYVSDAKVVDVNGDGNVDVIATNYDGYTSSILVLLNLRNNTTHNNPSKGNLTIEGILERNKTLTVSNTLTDADGLGTISFQWLSAGKAILGATKSTYILTSQEEGKNIGVVANYTDKLGTLESVTSITTLKVKNINDLPTGAVTISGEPDPKIGRTLTATNTLADVDGLGVLKHQWLADGKNIVGATASTYTLIPTDIGKSFSVKVSYTDGQGTKESITSAATLKHHFSPNNAPTGEVVVYGDVVPFPGEAKEGKTLSTWNALADIDGLGDISYQWLADGIAINGENASYYTVAPAEHGKAISVIESYTDGYGTKESVTSKQTDLVTNYAPTGEITIIGEAKVGSVLSIENTLADADGLPTDARDFSVQWVQPWFEESNKPRTDYYMTDYIYNATEDTYTITESNMTHAIAVRVTYLDGAGTNEVVVSQPTAKVTAASSEPTYGNDKLIGTAGNDVLSALAGNDTLIGGVGADVLTGGLGADIFVLNGITDSGITSANRDIITDFNSYAGDKIDLSSIHITVELDSYSYQYGWYKNVPLNFMGNDAFSKIDATGQLRFDAATHTLYGSNNADIKPEFSIQLNGVNNLAAGDFVL